MFTYTVKQIDCAKEKKEKQTNTIINTTIRHARTKTPRKTQGVRVFFSQNSSEGSVLQTKFKPLRVRWGLSLIHI